MYDQNNVTVEKIAKKYLLIRKRDKTDSRGAKKQPFQNGYLKLSHLENVLQKKTKNKIHLYNQLSPKKRHIPIYAVSSKVYLAKTDESLYTPRQIVG